MVSRHDCRMQCGLEIRRLFVYLFLLSELGREVNQLLVLGRKPGEYLMIGDDIMVKVVRSKKGDLRLAIHAPENIKITRGEIYDESGAHSIHQWEG